MSLETKSLSRVGRKTGFDEVCIAERISEAGSARSLLSFSEIREEREILNLLQSSSNWGVAIIRKGV